jgi:uncharacterized membrane protein
LGAELDDKFREVEQRLGELTQRVYRVEKLLEAQAPPTPKPFVPQPAQGAVVQTVETVLPKPVAELPTVGRSSVPQASPVLPFLSHALSEPSKSSQTLESVIGGQWLNRLGVIAVLFGLSYFLKLAIENDWIGPSARVLIGLAAGVGLLFWSERFRDRGFAAFSYSLKALGLGALYLSLWAAFQLYHLVPASSAFLAMVLVTMAAATFSIVQESELLAALALLGGFLTPVLVSTNQNREVALLSYLLLLDVGTVWVVAAKRWIRLLPGALAGTALLAAGWAFTYYSDNDLATTTIFATLFFLVFAAAPLLTPADSEQHRRWSVLECAVLVLNAAAYFVVLFAMMESQHWRLLAVSTCALAAACFLMGRALLQRRARSDLETAYFILAIAFFVVAVPIQFDGRWITFFWDIEATALLWISRQSARPLVRYAGAFVLFLAILRLIVVDSTTETTVLFNPRFGLYLLTIATAAFMTWISVEAQDQEWRSLAATGVVAFIALALVALSLEVHDYFQPLLRSAMSSSERHSIQITEAFSYSALWMLYGAALMFVGFWRRQALIRWLAIALLAMTAIKVFFVDISLLQRGYRIASFIALGIILLAVSFFYQRARVGTAEPK